MKALVALVPLLALALAPATAADPRDVMACPKPPPNPYACISVTLVDKLFSLTDGSGNPGEYATEIQGIYSDVVVTSDSVELARASLLLVDSAPFFDPTLDVDLGSVGVHTEELERYDFIQMSDVAPEDAVAELWLAYVEIQVSGLHYQVLAPVIVPPQA
jgi:hypothetical protein